MEPQASASMAWGSAFSLAWLPTMLLRLENAVQIEMGVNYASDKTKEKEISVEITKKEATRSNLAKLGNMRI